MHLPTLIGPDLSKLNNFRAPIGYTQADHRTSLRGAGGAHIGQMGRPRRQAATAVRGGSGSRQVLPGARCAQDRELENVKPISLPLLHRTLVHALTGCKLALTMSGNHTVSASALHLLNLAHATASSPLNRRYTYLFLRHVEDHEIVLPNEFESQRFCLSCGLKYIPGVNVKIRVDYKRRNGQCANQLVYTCSGCNAKHRFDLEVPKKKEPSEPTEPTEPIKSKSRQRAKKRKTTLSNMLAQKKLDTARPSLDLMKFMK